MKKRLVVFLLIFPAMLGPVFFYLAWRLTGFGWWALLLAAPFLSVASFPFALAMRSSRSSALETLVVRLAYFHMGLLSLLLVSTLLRDGIGLIFGYWLGVREILLMAGLAFIVGSFQGVFGPRIRRLRLPFPDLPPGLEGLRIAQISDLHIGASTAQAYVERVVKKTLELDPHLVALTGDIGDGRVQELTEHVRALSGLGEGARKVFFVHGNHEVYWNHSEWGSVLSSFGIKVLLNENVRVSFSGESIFIAGLTDPAFAMVGSEWEPNLDRASEGLIPGEFRILLSHRPHFAEAASEKGFHLQLSGHTHGGQFFPWTIVASLVHKYSLGAYQIGRFWVYVSAGTGSWGPKLRLGTRAEITLIELVSAGPR